MFKIKLNNTWFNQFNNFKVTLNYSALASTFSFSALDTSNIKGFSKVEVYYNSKLLLTGVITGLVNKVSSKVELVNVSGYTTTGVLQDCNFPKSAYPLQFENMSLNDIIKKSCDIFNIDYTFEVDSNEVFEKIEVDPSEKVADFLIKLALQRNLILTHGTSGNLVLTKMNLDNLPVQSLGNGKPGTTYERQRNYQALYSEIYAIKEQEIETNNAGDLIQQVPKVASMDYTETFRPITIKQDAGNENGTEDFAKSFTNSMLKDCQNVKITTDSITWYNGEIMTPNQLISIENKMLDIYPAQTFFIDSVDLSQGDGNDTAVLNCVFPEVV